MCTLCIAVVWCNIVLLPAKQLTTCNFKGGLEFLDISITYLRSVKTYCLSVHKVEPHSLTYFIHYLSMLQQPHTSHAYTYVYVNPHLRQNCLYVQWYKVYHSSIKIAGAPQSKQYNMCFNISPVFSKCFSMQDLNTCGVLHWYECNYFI